MQHLIDAIHHNAIKHGWWDCKTCKGGGAIFATYADDREERTDRPVSCPVCGGSGVHRDDTESLLLIITELAEATEALRDPKKLLLCDKCDGTGRTGALVASEPCVKCGGSGDSICGNRVDEEIVDAAIRIMDLAAARKMDLMRCIEQKHAYNLTRPFKHGKAF